MFSLPMNLNGLIFFLNLLLGCLISPLLSPSFFLIIVELSLEEPFEFGNLVLYRGDSLIQLSNTFKHCINTGSFEMGFIIQVFH